MVISLAFTQAHAADGTWNLYYSPYYDSSAPWSSSNWVDGIVADGADSTATFSNSSGSYSHRVTLDSARTIGNLAFGNPNTDPKYWSLTPSSPASVLTLDVSVGSPSVTVNGNTRALISASLSGTDGLTKLGVGSLNLSGVNSYTGATSINNGLLQFFRPEALYNNDAASWTSENISVASGATLAVSLGTYWANSSNASASAFSVAQTDALLSGLTHSINHNGLQAGSTFAIDTSNNSSAITYDRVIRDSTGIGGGALGFTKIGSYFDQLTLSQVNTYTGPTTVNGGILAISGPGTLGQGGALGVNFSGQVDLGGGTQTVGAVTISSSSNNSRGSIVNGNLVGTSYEIAGGGAVSAGLGGVGVNLSKTGTDTGLLSGMNTYGGTTTVSAGTLQFAKAVSLYGGNESSWTKENVLVASGATLSVNVGGVNDFTIAQSKTLFSNLTTSINNNGLQLGSSFALDTGNATGDTTYDGVIADSTGVGSGALGFTKLGTGKLILNQANTYTGPTKISGGTLKISGAGTLGNTADLVVNSRLDLGGSTQAVGAVTIHGGTIESISNGSLDGTSYLIEHAGWDYGNEYAGTVTAGLGGAGASLNKIGSLATTLSGTNTYTGATIIGGGTLKFAKTASLYNSDMASWTKENISVSNGVTLAVSIGGPGGFSVAQAKTLLTNLTTSIDNNGMKAGARFGIDTTNAVGQTTFDQVIADSTGAGSGSLGLTKLGSGTLVLNQANTYTGSTIISGGNLKISGPGTIGNQGDLIAYSGSNLDLGGSTQTVGAVYSEYGSITNGNLIGTSYTLDGGYHTAGLGGEGANLFVSNAYVYLEGANTYTGITSIYDGVLNLKKSASLYNADMSKWTKENISVSGSGYGAGLIISVGGAGAFTTAQAKTLLSNLTTSIDNNGLTAGSTFGIDTSQASGPVTFDQVIADSTGNGAGALRISVEGSQALVLNQANTYSGNTSLMGGHLKVGHANAIPSGAGKGAVTTQAWSSGDSTLDLNGFDVSINSLAGDGAKIVNDAVGTNKKLTLGSNDPAHSLASFGGQIADNSGTGGTLSLEKIGGSSQTLSGNNTYTGDTTVKAGILNMTGSSTSSLIVSTGGQLILSGTNTGNAIVNAGRLVVGEAPDSGTLVGNVEVNSGGTLGGANIIAGSVTVNSGGTLAPGSSIETLQSGSLNFANHSTYAYELDSGAEALLSADLHQAMGDLNLTGKVNLSLTNLSVTPVAFEPGTIFSLINYIGTWNGGLFTLGASEISDEGTFSRGLNTWKIDYNALSGGVNFNNEYFTGDGSGKFVNITAMTVIPEPSAMLLGALGGLALLRRRRGAIN